MNLKCQRNRGQGVTPCPLISALFLGENLSASAGWHALVRGEDDTGGRQEATQRWASRRDTPLPGMGERSHSSGNVIVCTTL